MLQRGTACWLLALPLAACLSEPSRHRDGDDAPDDDVLAEREVSSGPVVDAAEPEAVNGPDAGSPDAGSPDDASRVDSSPSDGSLPQPSDGPLEPAEPSPVRFGAVFVGDETIREIRLGGSGSVELTVGGPDFDLVEASRDTVVLPARVSLRYQPSSVGPGRGGLRVHGQQISLKVDLFGIGVDAPCLDLGWLGTCAGQVEFDEMKRRPAERVENCGSNTLRLIDQRVVSSDPRFFAGFEFLYDVVRPGGRVWLGWGFTNDPDLPQGEVAVGVWELDVEAGGAQGTLRWDILALPGASTDCRPEVVESVDFGDVTIGDTVERIVSVQNQGSGWCSIFSIRFTPETGAADFETNEGERACNDPSRYIGFRGRSDLAVRFRPREPGPQAAELEIPINRYSGDAALRVRLEGSGVPP